MQGAANQQLFEFAMRWQSAPHGTKGTVIEEAERILGMARATLHRKFKDMVATDTRKRRSDAGNVELPREEALKVSAVLMEHMRKNGKRTASVNLAIEQLRANGLIRAERIDQATGEIVPLSVSAISRALRRYQAHPDQLLRPAPAMAMTSLHPNHVWQIDASRCVMYYLPSQPGDNGLRIMTLRTMDEQEFYKNKPANLIKSIKDALWRYVVTDHTSGWVYVHYVIGGETSANLIEAFIAAMAQRPGHAMHGVPMLIMLDPGSANTSAAFKNLCHALRIRLQINKPGNPRAKGQVEKGQDLVERSFETLLKTLREDQVNTLEKINGLATKWMAWFNGTQIHTRHEMTRDGAWLRIKGDQLIVAPAPDVMRQVAVSAPESRVVGSQLTVQFRGREYDVSGVPGVLNGEKLLICRNAFEDQGAQAIGHTDDGYETFHILPEVLRNEFGMVIGAPVIGESYKRHADTPAQVNAKEIERLAMGASTDEEAAAARKQKAPFLGGAFNPLAHIEQTKLAIPMPRTGQMHDLQSQAPTVAEQLLTHIQAAKLLRKELADWSPAHYDRMVEMYPAGVPADEISSAAFALREAMRPRPTIVRVA
ncbi:transposase family protein [Pseudomonas aeruginosa]